MLRCPKRDPDLLKANALVAKLKLKLGSFASAPQALVGEHVKNTSFLTPEHWNGSWKHSSLHTCAEA